MQDYDRGARKALVAGMTAAEETAETANDKCRFVYTIGLGQVMTVYLHFYD